MNKKKKWGNLTKSGDFRAMTGKKESFEDLKDTRTDIYQ